MIEDKPSAFIVDGFLYIISRNKINDMTLHERKKHYRKYLDKIVGEMVGSASGLKEIIEKRLSEVITTSLKYRSLGKDFQFTASRLLEIEINDSLNELRKDIFNFIYMEGLKADNIAQQSNNSETNNSEAIMLFLTSTFADELLSSRIEKHITQMQSEIEAYVAIGISKNLSRNQILFAYMQNIQKPYVSMLMLEAFKEGGFKAERIVSKGITYGRGKYVSSFNNLKRLTRDNIFKVYAQMQQQIWSLNSEYAGWTTYRGSTFPCQVCDMEVGRFHKKEEAYFGYHLGCVCIPIPIYKSDIA